MLSGNSMTNFIFRGDGTCDIPRILSSIEGFANSLEYERLADYDRENPGVVLAAFGCYLSRLHQRYLSGDAAPSLKSQLSFAHQALESLSTSPSTSVRNLLIDECFAAVEDSGVIESVKAHLGPHGRELLVGDSQ